MLHIFNHIGFWGPIMGLGVGAYHLPLIDAMLFIIFAFTNLLTIKALKALIAQPRPGDPQALYSFEHYDGTESYGMPSGHASLSAFSVIYLYMYKGNIPAVTILALVQMPITLLQRYYTYAHSEIQLFAGMLVGTLMAYVSVMLAKRIRRRKEHKM